MNKMSHTSCLLSVYVTFKITDQWGLYHPSTFNLEDIMGVYTHTHTSQYIHSFPSLCSVCHLENSPMDFLQTDLANMNFQWKKIQHSGMSLSLFQTEKIQVPLVTKSSVSTMTLIFPFCIVNTGRNSTECVTLKRNYRQSFFKKELLKSASYWNCQI